MTGVRGNPKEREEAESGFVPAVANVDLFICDTGEMLQWEQGGYEADGEPWEKSALQLALDLVPHLTDAIDRGRVRRQNVTVGVTFTPGAAGVATGEQSTPQTREGA